jgi:hypothetical protein
MRSGQAADVVVALDGGAGAAVGGDALDHVWIKRALGEEAGAFDLFASASNTSMKVRPMNLRLASGSVRPARPVRNWSRASTWIRRMP